MFRIYGKTGCTWCTAVLEFLEYQGFPLEYFNIEEDEEAMQMIKDNGFSTVPQVFHGEDHIGGYEDTIRYTKGLE